MEAGGVPPLLSLLNVQVPDVQVHAAAAVAELCRDNPTVQTVVSKAGGIGPLLALLSSRSAAAQAHGMSALARLASRNPENQDAIAKQVRHPPREPASRRVWHGHAAVVSTFRVC